MNVAELIEHLKQIPPETQVFVAAPKTGYFDCSGVERIPILRDASIIDCTGTPDHWKWMFGPHHEADIGNKSHRKQAIKGCVLY